MKTIIVCVSALFFLLNCCQKENNPPAIQKVSASPETIKTGENSQITCIAKDENGDPLTYTWTAVSGTFTVNSNKSSTIWKSPLQAGKFDVSVSVSDGKTTAEDKTQITVEVAPEINISSRTLDFGSTSTQLTFELKNLGTGSLNWNLSKNQTWLTLSANSGSTTLKTEIINVTVNRTGLDPGSYSGKITISSNGGSEEINVTMSVQENPVLSVSPLTIDFGSTLTQSTIQIKNIGDGTLNWTLSKDQSWLTLNAESGSTSIEIDEIIISIKRTDLSVGNYSGKVTINSNGVNTFVNVSFTVTNQSPLIPSNPIPLTNATGILSSITLTWNCSDPDGDTLTYDVYFGTANPPSSLVSSLQSATNLSRYGLEYGVNYFWKIIARDSYGNSSIGPVWKFTTQIGIAPMADFTASKTIVNKGENIEFTNKSTNSPSSCFWTFGDGTTSAVHNPTKSYNVAGTYTITLKAINSYGENIKTMQDYITVNDVGGPLADFNPLSAIITKGQTIYFTDSSKYYPSNWLWIFGDGTTSTHRNPEKKYTSIGKFTVSLTVSNILGSDTKIVQNCINVIEDIGTGQTSTYSYNGYIYPIIKIGAQWWFAENLQTTKLHNGANITSITSDASWISSKIPAYCWYDYDMNKFKSNKYGALYNYYAVETKKLCPLGWHVPNRTEWIILENYLIINGYGAQGSGDDIYWSLISNRDWDSNHYFESISELPNKSGFSALPAGMKDAENGKFGGIGGYASWWGDEYTGLMGRAGQSIYYDSYTQAYLTSVYWGLAGIWNAGEWKTAGLSVRCIKD